MLRYLKRIRAACRFRFYNGLNKKVKEQKEKACRLRFYDGLNYGQFEQLRYQKRIMHAWNDIVIEEKEKGINETSSNNSTNETSLTNVNVKE